MKCKYCGKDINESFLGKDNSKDGDYIIKQLISDFKSYTDDELETFLTNNDVVLKDYNLGYFLDGLLKLMMLVMKFLVDYL